MKRRQPRPKKLWAVIRSRMATPPDTQMHAVPSSEAGLAACVEPGDRLVRWPFSAHWHAEESALFLASVESGVAH